MPLVAFLVAAQRDGVETRSANPPSAAYIVIAILAVVLVLVVWIFIQSGARRSSKR